MSDTNLAIIPRLLGKLTTYLGGRVPTHRRSHPLRRQPPQPVTASQLDVDQIHAILTQADLGSPLLLMSLYDTILWSDSHLQGELSKRKLAVLGDPWAVAPENPKDPADVAAARLATDQLKGMPSFFDALSALLDASLWPVAVVERVYRLSSTPGLRYDLDDLIPVPTSMLYFDPQGPLRVWDVDPGSGAIMATNQCVDPMRYITHRGHLLGDKDHRGGPMRSLVFWWLFSAFDRDWWARFLDKYGSPFMVGKYDQTDDDSRLILQQAFALASRLGGVVISKETDVEIKEAMSQSAGAAFEQFHTICQNEKSKLIVGQTTSASAQSAGGLGSGIGDAQADVRGDIRQFDRLRLADTIKHQIVGPWQEINGIPGRVTVSIGAEAPEDTEKTSRSLANLSNAGIEVADEGITALGERMGLPLRRKAAPPAVGPDGTAPSAPGSPSLTALSARISDLHAHLADAANGRVARAGAADLAAAFRGDLAPVARLLRESASAADFEARLRDHFPAWTPARTLPLLEAGLVAMSANGL